MPKGGSADPGAGFSGSGGRAAAGEIGRAAADRAGGGQGTTPAERARGQAEAAAAEQKKADIAALSDLVMGALNNPKPTATVPRSPDQLAADAQFEDEQAEFGRRSRNSFDVLSTSVEENPGVTLARMGIPASIQGLMSLLGMDVGEMLGATENNNRAKDLNAFAEFGLVDPQTPTPNTNQIRDGGDGNLLSQVLANPSLLARIQANADLSSQALETQKTGFRDNLSSVFTGDAFGDIDEGIISSIIDERRGPSNQLIANAGARGNFNPQGGAAANRVLDEQEGPARQRIANVGEGIFSTAQQGINEVRDRASGEIDNFTLGGSFDLQPFTDERQGLIDTQLSTLGDDLRSGLGADPLFDPKTALQAGGSAQGLVSGAPSNQPLLDTIAQRQQQSSNTNRRGLRTSGNGAF